MAIMSDLPIVPMMDVRRKFLGGEYSMFRPEVHSSLVRFVRWSRAFAILERSMECSRGEKVE